MNASSLIGFLRARPILIVSLVAVALTLALLGRPRRNADASAAAPLLSNGPLPTASLVRPAVGMKPIAPKLEVAVVKTNPPLLGVHIRVELPPDTNPPALGLYAPAGRLIRAVTINALHSGNIDTPVIGLVTDELWHDGQLILPAGTELHGRASIGRARDRIVASGPWIVVLQTGEELTLTGIALDRDDGLTPSGSLDGDGVAGLKGHVIRTDSAAELKLFASTFLSGAASAFQQQRTTALGTEVLGNARNAALGGASAVLNSYAQQISEAIKRDGAFVYVPAGKPFYLYATHTLDRSQAKIGNLRVSAVAPPPLLNTPNPANPP